MEIGIILQIFTGSFDTEHLFKTDIESNNIVTKMQPIGKIATKILKVKILCKIDLILHFKLS